jgi:SAM-dependent methyltransferase
MPCLGIKNAIGRFREALAEWLHWPIVGYVRFGDLGRVQPISRVFGLDRGGRALCIDRYYIEQFLSTRAGEIQGRVLEIADDIYTARFGNGKVTRSDILHVNDTNPRATLIADLTKADTIPSDSFDCIICTQTLQFIYDLRAAVNTLHRILRPGGVLLATVPGISQISRYDMDRWGDYWRFTTRSLETLLGEFWPRENVEVRSCGNVLAAVAYLHGLTTRELTSLQLDSYDPDYQLVLTVRAVKPLDSSESVSSR